MVPDLSRLNSSGWPPGLSYMELASACLIVRDHDHVKSLSRVWFFATPWTVTYQAPLSIEFYRQEYWSGLLFPSPGDPPNTGIKPGSPTLQADTLPSEPPERGCYQKSPHYPQECYKHPGTHRAPKTPAALSSVCWLITGTSVLREVGCDECWHCTHLCWSQIDTSHSERPGRSCCLSKLLFPELQNGGKKKNIYIYIYVYIYTPDSRKHGEDSTKKLAKYYFLFSWVDETKVTLEWCWWFDHSNSHHGSQPCAGHCAGCFHPSLHLHNTAS